MRRSYKIEPLKVNGKDISEVVIDSHVDKHSDHITDEIILDLVKDLESRGHDPVDIKSEFSYFASNIDYKNSAYKLVWLMENKCIYIGIVTAYKDRRVKK